MTSRQSQSQSTGSDRQNPAGSELPLLDRARAWAESDPDPATAEELRSLIRAAEGSDPAAKATAESKIASMFNGRLEFGTAGLRGAIAPGPNRMNVAVVRHTAAGLARFLTAEAKRSGFSSAPHVVIGFDARHRSADFARESAGVLTAAGLAVSVLPSALPTPVLAFALRELGADAGIMVTASHNPPADNGYKVYLGGRVVTGPGQGAQIVPPYDGQIASAILEDLAPADEIPTAESGWTVLDADVRERYIAAALEALGPAEHELSIVTTAMHGVGGATLVDLLRRAGYTRVTPVAEQQEPDPDFPTVSFPNPEEPGAIDLALKTAEREGADLVIANDPDADRCAVAALDPELGAWRMLRGDELGAVFGAWALERIADGAADGGADGAGGGDGQNVVANSVVSSRLLGAMAEAAGVEHRQTLTGFKWIAREAGLRFGFEEAIGYLVTPGLVRDKDGITAGLAIAHIAASLKAEGRTLFDVLDELYLKHGVHQTDQLSLRLGSISLVTPLMGRLRTAPPESLGGSDVVEVVDLSEGWEALPPTDGLLYLTRDRSRVIVRPSGTEPKLKAYIETIVEADTTSELAAAKETAQERIARIREDLSDALGL
ncbi:phospho-sugar mutase [Arthrobacter sp. UM1]|uniref:phospho-sugar mutase n=1 Tax=Arthrobacter sp. UM1 TaxID=2766776 RepID=UPI001CF6D7FF|nr:phospho-sugar mutase [Arthrobacter sp. UM1]MCB4208010.1 phospho-sugar mutase [Arthrobacter sp. UM1]